MTALKKTMSTGEKIKYIFESKKYYTVAEIMKASGSGYSTAANVINKLLISGWLKKAKFEDRRVMLYAIDTAGPLFTNALSIEARKDLLERTTVKRSLKVKKVNKNTLKKVIPSSSPKKEKEVETLKGMPKSALAAVEAIGMMSEDNVQMFNFIKQIHEDSGKIITLMKERYEE